ncbi:unnamed protein product [Didymodactylos carnosus]|uniref:Uncharacterized protein n=1 Tax=Didymodactylos carnosus TaxID=1234261 RepID=A0A814Z2H5_9BILA|nr:unnamed protein product [Didymodactylos carnosus]CAF1238120.1 unnamed protein product [Didymodactylos carnosus]CAF3621086.1 unnamed protein product [Didymodactylos carnosus]CAF4000346.1 unnamed protein product [Didymodactylos carnosus]
MLHFSIGISFIVLISVVYGSTTNDSCQAGWSKPIDCHITVGTACKDATFHLNLPEMKDCEKPEIFWDAPTNNLTIVFEREMSGKPYNLCIEPVFCLKNAWYHDEWTGRQIRISFLTGSDKPTCFRNRKGTNTMKFTFDAGSEWQCYGTFIRYSYKN